MDTVGAYKDSLTKKNKLARLAWNVFALFFFRPFVGPFFRYYRSFALRLWGAKIGTHCAISAGVRIWAPWNLVCGDYVAVAKDAELYNVAPIRIGHHVTVSQGAYLCAASHDISYRLKPLVFGPITLGDFTWVCARAIVMRGVTMNEGSVVAAGAVVTKDVEPWTVVGGNPAKVIKKRELRTGE